MSRKHRDNDLLSSSFATRGGYNEEATTSLSHTLSLSHALYNKLYTKITTAFQHYESMCPKSYLYIYDFSAYLHMCPSQSVRTNRYRFWDRPVLFIFHPEGHVFPTLSLFRVVVSPKFTLSTCLGLHKCQVVHDGNNPILILYLEGWLCSSSCPELLKYSTSFWWGSS